MRNQGLHGVRVTRVGCGVWSGATCAVGLTRGWGADLRPVLGEGGQTQSGPTAGRRVHEERGRSEVMD